MDSSILAMMLGASLILGSVALGAFIWGLKSGQFDDSAKMFEGVLNDSVEDLNDAYERDRKIKQMKKEKRKKEKEKETTQNH